MVSEEGGGGGVVRKTSPWPNIITTFLMDAAYLDFSIIFCVKVFSFSFPFKNANCFSLGFFPAASSSGCRSFLDSLMQ